MYYEYCIKCDCDTPRTPGNSNCDYCNTIIHITYEGIDVSQFKDAKNINITIENTVTDHTFRLG